MTNQISLGTIGQVARSVKNMDAAWTWYGEVLGLKPLYRFGNLGFFDCNGLRLFLSEGEGASESILYFRVADVRTAYAAMMARGIEFTHAPHMIHKHDNGLEEWMAFFKDNEGRPLAIMAQVPGA
jgi:catechol 2,3-dioxygenase-like lactoylglutathione lyase family enzyme